MVTKVTPRLSGVPGLPWQRAAATAGPAPRPSAPPSIRSAQRRRWSADLLDPANAGLIIHGTGGIGKSSLAAGIVSRVSSLEPERLTTLIRGDVSADRLLTALAASLGQHPMAAAASSSQAEATSAAARTGLPWAHRLALLREHVLTWIPVLVVLDDFDDNLSADSGSWSVRDSALAGLLASWRDTPHPGRLLITCRRPFTLPGADPGRLGLRRLGPLSRIDAGDLARPMPALGRLSEQELDRAWRLTGGHPRTMEYLDALLTAGLLTFQEVSGRLADAIQDATGQPVPAQGPGAPAGLPPGTAEAIAGAAGDLLLSELYERLSADAQRLLIGVSVYRSPVAGNTRLVPPGRYRRTAELAGPVAECEAAGLLRAGSAREPGSLFVHQWTASQLHRHLAAAQRGHEVQAAHRRAAEYWQWRAAALPHDPRGLPEASYHLIKSDMAPLWDTSATQDRRHAARLGRLPTAWLRGLIRRTARPGRLVPAWLRGRLIRPGAGMPAVVVVVAALVAVAGLAATGGMFLAAGTTGPAGASAGLSSGLSPGRADARASLAAAVRGQAAAWVARQVSGDAIVGCDPAMCTALQAHGVEAGKLLMLQPSAADPFGADVLMATAAIRSQFGSRLASVYAPAVIASFGSGALRIDVRAVAPEGMTAYRAALAADLAVRREAGSQLLRNRRISVSPGARSVLAGGRADARLLMTLTALAAIRPLLITGFSGGAPGAGAGVPLRAVEVAAAGGGPGRARSAGGAGLRAMLTFVRAQRPPYLPVRAGIVRNADGSPVLAIEFAAPSPIGLLQDHPVA